MTRRDDAPCRRDRLLVAALVAGMAAIASALLQRAHVNEFGSDFAQLWHGARALLAGESPYRTVGPSGTAFYWPAPLMYPATALVAVAPLSALPLPWAEAAFVFLSAFALAYGITRSAWWPLIAFASASSFLAAQFVQWTYLLTASLSLPLLGAFVGAKPTIGAAIAAGTTSRRWWVAAVLGTLSAALLATALHPAWPLEWLQALRAPSAEFVVSGSSASNYSAPLLLPGGPLILLALLRWRRPEARLLIGLASVPQTLVGTELLPLLVMVPRTRLEALALVALSWGVRLGTGAFGRGASWQETFTFAGRLSVWLVFLPCVALILRRPSEVASSTAETSPSGTSS